MRTEAQQAAVVANNHWNNAADAVMAAKAAWEANPCEATNDACAKANKAERAAWKAMDRAVEAAS